MKIQPIHCGDRPKKYLREADQNGDAEKTDGVKAENFS